MTNWDGASGGDVPTALAIPARHGGFGNEVAQTVSGLNCAVRGTAEEREGDEGKEHAPNEKPHA